MSPHRHCITTYTTDGRERELLLVARNGAYMIVDVLADDPHDHLDLMVVEEDVPTIDEAQAIAEDYVRKARKLGFPPMFGCWI